MLDPKLNEGERRKERERGPEGERERKRVSESE